MGIYKPRRTRAMNAASGNGAKPNPNIHQSQGNTNIPTNPGNGLPNTATTPGNITTPGNNPGNPATALNPGAVTPGNNIGHQPLNPGNQLANPNNSLTPGQANLANPQSTVTPGQQATTPNSSQKSLQNNIGTIQSSPQPYFTSSTGKTENFFLTRQDIQFSNQQLYQAGRLPYSPSTSLTNAGRSYQKHSNGVGANPNLPKMGSYQDINEAADKFVETILSHPNAVYIRHVVNKVEFYHIKVPGLGGLSFDANGNLKGFLNP